MINGQVTSEMGLFHTARATKSKINFPDREMSVSSVFKSKRKTLKEKGTAFERMTDLSKFSY